MPRVAGIYSRPTGIDAVANNTIDSGKYNSNVADVEADLNLPRPIVAGGTGATTADDALTNLSAEKRGQLVTNYDTFVFVDGSFYSNAGATGAPQPTGAFCGICYRFDANNLVIQARRFLSTVPDATYVRQRQGGVWGTWVQDTGTQVDTDARYDARYVNVTGDNMTGNLTSSGAITAAGIVTSNSQDGLQINAAAGNPARVRTAVAGVRAWTCGTVSDGSFTIADEDAAAFRMLISTGGAVSIFGALAVGGTFSVANVMSANGYQTRSGTGGPPGGNYFNITHGAGQSLWIDGTNAGTFAYTSDYRIKKDVLDLPGMWDTVKTLRPIKYTQKTFNAPAQIAANIEAQRKEDAAAAKEGRPPITLVFNPLYEADNIERWGFIAHELQATLTPSAASGVKDSPDTIQSPNPFTLLAALAKALQEAQARIEMLEAAVGTTPTATILQRLDVLDKFREKIEAL
jgi:hypothetical protein